MKTRHSTFTLAILLSVAPLAFAEQAAPPDWFVEHLTLLVKDSGRWIADNSEFKSADEPFDAYGTEWALGIGGKSLTGRLFGLQDGKEVATFWEFRSVWHPGEKKAYVYQYGGDGTFAVGTLELVKGSRTRSDQTFFRPDGTSSRTGHEEWFSKDGRHYTQSFDIGEDGKWKKRRLYVWGREP